jgi:DNA-binding response OmpR family regulator
MAGEKILIVDDDKDQLIGLNVRLRANKYNVVIAHDAVMAVSVARKENPDLIILDIGLPAGDGFVVMERLRNLISLSHIPIIILTAREPTDNKERALSEGAYAFFQKPVDNQELLTAINNALSGVSA